jgi:RimJ/RimL family protein N-acetyltransferase
MSDSAIPASPAETPAPFPAIRAAAYADLDLVQARLGEAIAESPHYGETFKAYEAERLSKPYLASLLDADPHHVMLLLHEGEPGGFIISGPELGTLWLYWCYVFPEYRRTNLAIGGMRAFTRHWDKGRFHKIATYVRPGNRAAEMILLRLGFERIALLRQHIFGEDYQHYERALTKIVPGYDRGTRGGLGRRLVRMLRLAAAR